MSRSHFSVGLALFLLAGCASSYTPRANTRADIVSYVNHAASVVAKNGPSCDTFNQPNWMSGDWYIFVDGPDGRLICHPNAQMVGRSNADIVDVNGKRVGDAITAAGISPEGHGWVDYVWPRPGQTTPVAKSTYVTRVTGPDGKMYLVGAGGYELK